MWVVSNEGPAAGWIEAYDAGHGTRQTHRWEQEEARIVAPEALRNCLLHRVDGVSTYDIPPATLQVGFPEMARPLAPRFSLTLAWTLPSCSRALYTHFALPARFAYARARVRVWV